MTADAAFCRYYGCKPVQETGVICAICGYDIQPDEEISWNAADEICHAECLLQEEDSYDE